MSTKVFDQKFWGGFVIGMLLTLSVTLIVTGVNQGKQNNTIRHYEKIGECHYTFDIDTITNEVKSIRYFVPVGDKESWERKNSATGRDE